jgi:hypothetical protein
MNRRLVRVKNKLILWVSYNISFHLKLILLSLESIHIVTPPFYQIKSFRPPLKMSSLNETRWASPGARGALLTSPPANCHPSVHPINAITDLFIKVSVQFAIHLRNLPLRNPNPHLDPLHDPPTRSPSRSTPPHCQGPTSTPLPYRTAGHAEKEACNPVWI